MAMEPGGEETVMGEVVEEKEGVRRRRGDGDGGGGESEGEDSGDGARMVVVRNENPFFFWLGFMSIISVVMLVFVLGTSVLNWNDSIEILSMPAGVREHFEAGKLVKVEVGRDRSPVKVFVRGEGEVSSGSEVVVLLHGLGASSFLYRKVVSGLAERGICGVAVDLPGAGLAEKAYLVDALGEEERGEEDREPGFLRVRFEALKELLVEGFFRATAEESGEHEFLAKLKGSTKLRKGKKVLALGPDELGDALDQIVASLELAPVHLVMHDTGVEVGLAWASQNPTKVASITLVDSVPRSPSLPFWLFRIPVLGAVMTHSDLAFRWVLRSCCFSSVTAEGAEDYAYLLRSSDGLQALLESLAVSNSSIDVAGWVSHLNLEGIPMQILWASGWSKEWQHEGEQLAASLPAASFHSHHGSRWPQEDAAPEIAEMIAEFVKSLPLSVRHQKDHETLFELAQNSGGTRSRQPQEERGRNHGHHHSHEHELGYMEGLGQAPGVGHGGWVL
ncbi:hypothetical protein M758_3G252100 [Ceratodon purpureus]|nr:hypothetical protein M758_3G252100 [Ceratodon purpureus]